MIRHFLCGVVCIVILFSIQTVFAQEELALPEGKNIKEWESISAALVAEKRYEEAIIYLDKILDEESNNLKALSNKAGLFAQLGKFSESLEISNQVLEIDSQRISTLTNKAIALKMLNEYEKSFDVFTKILTLEPENEKIEKSRANLLSGTPTISTNDSKFEVHVLVSIRDVDGNLIAVTESTNSRYLPSKFTEQWWNSLDKKEYITYENGIAKFQKSSKMLSSDDHLGMLTLERAMHGYKIVIFESFIPMIQMDEKDSAEIQWTILKK
tara:strand:+ start:498 stop:1304 length:807 start_codon:yes stop_codon:yes gene_type:complete